jgi:hypothetical protein
MNSEKCVLPRGPIFNAGFIFILTAGLLFFFKFILYNCYTVSYWEGFYTGAMNVIDLMVLSNHLNGTSVDPYVNDLNSQHPYSVINLNQSIARRFSEVFNLDHIKGITHIKKEPIDAYKLKHCKFIEPCIHSNCKQVKMSVNIVNVIYDSTNSAILRDQKCKNTIKANEISNALSLVGKEQINYWCIPNFISELPDQIIQANSVNIILNWHGIESNYKKNETRRLMWYARFISKVPLVDIYDAVHKEFLIDHMITPAIDSKQCYLPRGPIFSAGFIFFLSK